MATTRYILRAHFFSWLPSFVFCLGYPDSILSWFQPHPPSSNGSRFRIVPHARPGSRPGSARTGGSVVRSPGHEGEEQLAEFRE